MSDKNKGISPFKDPAFLKGSANKRKTEISDKDIKDFRDAFGDGESVKTYKPRKSPAKAPDKKSTSTEDLYKKPSVDIDAFFETLTEIPIPKDADAPKKEIPEPPSNEKTRVIGLGALKKAVNKNPPAEEDKNLKKNVRVLVKNKQSDQHILDFAVPDEEKTNIIDVLGTKKGEDIFTAVDRALTKDSDGYAAAIESVNKKERRERDKKAAAYAKELRDKLIKKNNRRKLKLIFCGVFLLLTLIISLLPSLYTNVGAVVYGIINIVLLLILIGVFFPNYLQGAKQLIRLSPDGNSTLLIVSIFVLIYDITLMVLGTPSEVNYTCFAAFAAGAACISEFFGARTTLGTLATAMKNKNLISIQPIDSTPDAVAVAKGITDKGDPNVLYSTDTEIIDSLPEEAEEQEIRSKFYTYSSIAVTAIGLILGVVAFFINGSALNLVTVLLSVICFCSPVTVRLTRTLLSYTVNRRLHKDGAAATSSEAIRLVGKAHGVAMDISDIFTAEVSSFKLAPAVFINRDTAALYAASVLINGKSLIGKGFKSFIQQTEAELPVAENIQYEEKLGFSAWIGKKRVLVGNREMLVQHSIPAPDEREEKHYAGNRFTMYLVVGGRLTASFLVNYKALSSVKNLTGEFNKTGLVLLLTSREPFLDNKEIAKRLSVESAAVKVLSGKSEATVKAYRNAKSFTVKGGLICSKSGNGLMSLVVNTYKLYNCDRFLFNLHFAGQLAALILLILAVFLNMPIFFNPLAIIGLELFWSIASFALTFNRIKNF
ncbi:MAG: hypothetical protein IKY78_03635 [Clostridia bacterium]|nr:hypothetical protein [Clostridia bacterium]